MDDDFWDSLEYEADEDDPDDGLTAEDVRAALLRYNFFPDQSENHDEIPPCFSATTFSDEAANRLVGLRSQRKGGFDEVSYKMTRHDLVPRVASIPHPLPYAQLVCEVTENWSNFEFIQDNVISQIRPQKRKDDSRIIIRSGYDEDFDQESPLPRDAGRRFEVHADIASFYPSIYTHSIPWALAGRQLAKADRSKKRYFNRVDAALQNVRRGETKGIAIGPGTSNIVSETLLTTIDIPLSRNFDYTRYIDDYTFFAKSEDEAREFISTLEHELAGYRLSLNPRKTTIRKLPAAKDEAWVNQLRLTAPDQIDSAKHASYLDLAVSLGSEYPDGSTIKYAVRTLFSAIGEEDVPEWLADRVVGLAFHRPVLLPLLRIPYEADAALVRRHMPVLNEIGNVAAKHRRSDVMAWVLYLLGHAGLEIDAQLAKNILSSEDTMAITVLADVGTSDALEQVKVFANGLQDAPDYDRDGHWLLLHMLHKRRLVPARKQGDEYLDVLDQEDVTFYTGAIDQDSDTPF